MKKPTDCKFCARSEPNHEGMAHAFVPSGSPETLQEATKRQRAATEGSRPQEAGENKPVQIRVQQTPFDPALRLALIDAGIITQDQLTAAMEKLSVLNNLTRLEESSSQDQTSS